MSPISSVSPSPLVSSATAGGLAAISAGSTELAQDAQQIANPDNGVPIAPMADLSQASLIAEAGAAVVRASDKMLGSLLDLFA
jgi:hypothetical protein